jgi:ATP-dependent Clp protease ATP-binding subunit ClpC
LLRLQQLIPTLIAVGDSSAHPRDVLNNESFREAITLLESKEIPLTTIADDISGANWMLAAAACAALCSRPDREQLARTVTAGLQHLRTWPLYYALEYFTSIESRPPTGAMFVPCPEWWSDNPLIPGFFAEHFNMRTRLGDPETFGGALARANRVELANADTFLRKVDHPTARKLLYELAEFRRMAIDWGFLAAFGRFLERGAAQPLIVEHDAVTEHLAQAEACVVETPPKSLLVVGEPRSGKSAFLSLLAQRLLARGWLIFEASAAQVMSGQVYIGELEERVRRLTIELAAEKRVLWHVPDFLAMATSGSHRGQSATILDQVWPAIASGRVVVFSEITPAAWTGLLQQRPGLRTALELIRLRQLTDAETDRLARQVADAIAYRTGVDIAPDVLDASAHLARHYLGTGQMPGAVLDLLKLSADRAATHDRSRVERDDVLAMMAQLTGMPQQVLDDRERVDLAVVRAFFTDRVIGQAEAIDAVVDRIAMLKAGLTDPHKPIGVFLFAGPTGTGKTELAKTLAEFLFGSPDRLIRLDMSEFQNVDSLRKIVGDAAYPQDTDSLAHRVRKQPFSVVLLDEFEKAHSNAWDLFLQVFDDGRLTDAQGHTTDFRHCIIILTSNVGSTIKVDAGPGFVARTEALSSEQVMKAIRQSFRPELINRLDRIIVFRALTREHMRSIVVKELARVLERRGLRDREWAVEWEASALDFLLDKGFSPAMGARPLKRAIDRHLLAPLAATLVEHRYPQGDQFLFVRSDGRALQVEFVDPDAAVEETAPLETDAVAPGVSIARMMLHPTGVAAERTALMAELERVEASLGDDRWTAIVNELASRMQRADFWNAPDRQAILSRFEVMDRVKLAAETAHGLARRLDRSAGASGRYSKDLIARLASQLFVVRHGIDDVVTNAPVEVVLAVQLVLDRQTDAAMGAQWCERLLQMYRKWAARRGMHISEVSGAAGSRSLLVISGFGAARLLEAEAGLHVLDYEEDDESGRAVARVTVRTTPMHLPESDAERYAVLTAELDRGPQSSTVIRRYRLDSSPVIRDLRQGWRTGRVELVFDGHFDVMGELWPETKEETST